MSGETNRLLGLAKELMPNASTPEAMRERKRAEFARLRADFPGMPAEPNNALLASIAVYTELVPAFERLLAESGSFETFYRRVQELAASEPSKRSTLLSSR